MPSTLRPAPQVFAGPPIKNAHINHHGRRRPGLGLSVPATPAFIVRFFRFHSLNDAHTMNPLLSPIAYSMRSTRHLVAVVPACAITLALAACATIPAATTAPGTAPTSPAAAAPATTSAAATA